VDSKEATKKFDTFGAYLTLVSANVHGKHFRLVQGHRSTYRLITNDKVQLLVVKINCTQTHFASRPDAWADISHRLFDIWHMQMRTIRTASYSPFLLLSTLPLFRPECSPKPDDKTPKCFSFLPLFMAKLIFTFSFMVWGLHLAFSA
jgi:hypothetical protein